MSIWKRALQALGLDRGDDGISLSGDRLIFHDVRRARKLPQEPPEAGARHRGICDECGASLRKVVFTTAGEGPQAAVWQAYPLAVDGWLCTACGWAAAPRFITPEESVEYGRRGTEHASRGEFDDAEFWFRRIIGSWPGYHAGYTDLGQLMARRADGTEDGDERARLRGEAMCWFERAIEADPKCSLPVIRLMFARVLALTGDEERATELLDVVLSMSEASEELRATAGAFRTELREGVVLFARATEVLRQTIFEPPGQPLSPAARSATERGRALLAEAAGRKATFRTLFFLGKSELRLRNWEPARAALQRAHDLAPENADGCQELAWAYLELERAREALPYARRASELRPGDPGLQCNLAIVLLLTGDVPAARVAAEAAIALDPGDPITKRVRTLIDDVDNGRADCPQTLAQIEGRGR